MRTIYFFALLVALTCATLNNVFAQPKKETAIYTEEKTAFIVTSDQAAFTLKLKSNPTTGYSWFLTEYNGALIEPVEHHFLKPDNQQLVGAPGYELWKFRVKPAGFKVPQLTQIHLAYMRPWESTPSSHVLVYRIATGHS